MKKYLSILSGAVVFTLSPAALAANNQLSAIILNQNQPTVTECTVANQQLNNCAIFTPENKSGQPALNQANTAAWGTKIYQSQNLNNKILFTLSNIGAPNVNSQFVICNLESDGNIDECVNTNTIDINSNATRLYYPDIYNHKIYFSSQSATTGIDAAIYSCSFNPDGTINNQSCIATQSSDPSTYSAFFQQIVVRGNKLYALKPSSNGGNGIVVVYCLDAKGNVLANSAVVMQGNSANGSQLFQSPRALAFTDNNTVVITDPGYNANNNSLITCNVTGDGTFNNCQANFGTLQNGSNAFQGPVGIATVAKNIFVMNYGYNDSQLANNIAGCETPAFPNPAAHINCSINQFSHTGSEAFFVPMSMAVTASKQSNFMTATAKTPPVMHSGNLELNPVGF